METAALAPSRLPVLNRLVLAECGGGDGVVTDPLACWFDPMQYVCKLGADPSGCLTAGGLLPVSEANWRGTLVSDDEKTPPKAKRYSGGVLNNLAFAPGSQTPTPESQTDDKATYARLKDSRRTYDEISANLDLFFARGGRLIVWHGLADQDLTPRTTLA